MSGIDRPRNDGSRSALLNTSSKVALTENYLMEGTKQRLHDFAPHFSSRVSSISDTKSTRIKESREKQEALVHLVMTVRHGMHAIKNRIERQKQPLDLLALYQLPQSGMLPVLRPRAEVIETAKAFVDGDRTAVERGFAPLTNPDEVELQTAIDAAEKEIEEHAKADRVYDEASEELAELRAEADELIADIIDELQFNLRKMDDSSVRRIMRSYGVKFKNDSGTVVAE